MVLLIVLRNVWFEEGIPKFHGLLLLACQTPDKLSGLTNRPSLGRFPPKIPLSIRILSDYNGAMDFLAEPLSPLNRQVRSKFESACPFNSFDWDLKIRQRFVIRDLGVGEDKGPERDVPTGFPIFGKDDFEEMGRHRNVGRTPDHFVGYPPFAIGRILPGKVEGTGDDPYGRVVVGQPTTEILEVSPVISVEAISHLRAHVTQQKCLIHRFLTPFGIGRRDLVPPIIARPEIV